MGFGLPAAIGMQLARPQARIAVITGDGSLMMNVQELATVRRYDLPIKIVVFDNCALGLVRQWQECFFDRRFSEIDLSDNPDFAEVARAFGIPSIRVDESSQVESALQQLNSTAGPLFLHVPIEQGAKVWPLVAPGKSNSEMLDGVPA
jgi:acetolactate synthase-1/2/3 large subunit